MNNNSTLTKPSPRSLAAAFATLKEKRRHRSAALSRPRRGEQRANGVEQSVYWPDWSAVCANGFWSI